MASTTSPFSLSSSSTLVDGKTTRQSSAAASSQCVTLPTLPPPPPAVQSRAARTTAYCRKIARNVAAMATSTGEVATAETTTAETATTELPSEFVQKIQEVWDKVDDKYAVSSLGVAAFILLWSSTGVVSAIDRLPLIPGVLELVGIGYTGWFAYKNLIFKPDREALIAKIKDLYNDILGSS
ncbi:protein CURVATURE THYLAKOID 1B, chloroplastic [Solanum dulcamara]|uniref:protein CURVATURE THYLAKOID 1B, chloroplastic n=1 Tax=Solanum dulcamara TaxID=45834 RepID=UPI002485FD8C|nr:protein CURVATURE THYLAKOID 1B, chloroplastic [Solanum dulcamara]